MAFSIGEWVVWKNPKDIRARKTAGLGECGVVRGYDWQQTHYDVDFPLTGAKRSIPVKQLKKPGKRLSALLRALTGRKG